MLGLNSELESSCLPGQLRYIIHFLHAFDSDAVDLPLRPIANRFGGCFCLGSGPVFCVLVCFRLFASLFPLAKRKSGWGICGSSFLVWLCFWFCCFIDLLILRTFLSLYSVLSAYSHVRTEPLVRHRPHSRKKKRQQGKAKDIFSTLSFSFLRISNHFYFSISSIRFFSRLFYSSALLFYSSFCGSQIFEKPSPWIFISKRIFF